MQIADLETLIERLLDSSEIDWARHDQFQGLIIPREGGSVVFIAFEEIEVDDEPVPLIGLDAPLFERVSLESVPSGRLAQINHDLLIGKLSWDEDGSRLTLQHEMVAWPGAAEFRVALQVLADNANAIRAELAEEIEGRVDPVAWSDLVEEQ
ncbi:MAG: hypothetical protein WKF33_06090 [Thermoleophilaceae bacterium]